MIVKTNIDLDDLLFENTELIISDRWVAIYGGME